MSKPLRAVLYIVAMAAAVGLVLVVLDAIDRSPEPPEPSGPTSDDAIEAILELEGKLARIPIWVDVAGTRFELIPAAIGFDLDEYSILDAALETGSAESVLEAVKLWVEQDQATVSWPIVPTVDEAALSRMLDEYDSLLHGPQEGNIVVEGTTPVPQYPRSGLVIDRSTAGSRIVEALGGWPRPELVLIDTIEEMPVLSIEAVDSALDEARLLLDGPVTLTRTDPDATLVLSVERLARALLVRVERVPEPRLVVGLDPAVIDGYIEPLRTGFVPAPVDARFVIDDEDNITIVPGIPGAIIDAELAALQAVQGARNPNRTTVLPLVAGVVPQVSAEELEALGVKGKISEFTTKHPCCQPRVNNIQLFARTIDGLIVWPGQVVSLNDAVGERTFEKGYVPAPTIIRGEITDTVGGGVSQFATTFYNAVFWAGLEIIEHQPHSYYFSRYPEGIEATISWRQPELVFRNDTNHAVVIKTAYTSTSITVKLFGDNSDRRVDAWVTGRFDPKEFPTVYFPNPELMPWDEELEVQRGADGWSVKVTRDLTFVDGSTTTEDWIVRYRPWPRHVEVHPCLLPEDSEDYTGEECPLEPATIPTTEDSPTSTEPSTDSEAAPPTTTSEG